AFVAALDPLAGCRGKIDRCSGARVTSIIRSPPVSPLATLATNRLSQRWPQRAEYSLACITLELASREGSPGPPLQELLGIRHVAKRIDIVLGIVAGIMKVPHVHRVVSAIDIVNAIHTGIGVEQNRINCGTHHEVAMVGPVSCRSCVRQS